jgi:hypothetical protein
VIAWWGWVLIWAGLVVALLAMVALFAWRLFRRFLGVLDDFFVLTEKTAVLDGVDQTHEPRRFRDRPGAHPGENAATGRPAALSQAGPHPKS